MDNIEVKEVNKWYNQEMLAILRESPINAGGLSLYFDKSPDIFAIPRMKYKESEHLGFFINDSLQGFGSLGYFDVMIKGRQENVFSFYNFYLLPKARGKQITHLAIKDFFIKARLKANYGISITLKGNRATEYYIGKQLDVWMPPTRIIDELVVKSILFALPKRNKTEYKIRNARIEDIPDIVKLLSQEHSMRDFGIIFSQVEFQTLLKKRGLAIEDYYVAEDLKGFIKGVCLAWDCNSFRRTRVLHFAAKFYPTLLTYKAIEKVIPLTPFPEKGEYFRELTITDYAVVDRNPVIMNALLSEIYFRNNNKKYHFMNWASCKTDPLLTAVDGFWYKNICSHIIFTSMDEKLYTLKPRLPYIDIAFI